MDVAERYVWLCLRVGRHVDGFVDAFIGPREWERSVAAEDPVDRGVFATRSNNSSTVSGTQTSRRTAGGGSGVSSRRSRASPRDCRGEDLAWADEVERCLGVRPTPTDTDVIEDVHRLLDAALPGSGTVHERWDANNAVPPDKLVPALGRLREVLGPRAHALATCRPRNRSPTRSSPAYRGSPSTDTRGSTGVAWRSTPISRSRSPSWSISQRTRRTPVTTRSERRRKRLYRGLGRVETSVVITPAPESTVSEGVGLNALEAALGPEPSDVLAEVLADLDVRFDPVEAREIHRAELDLYATATNAAFLLHEDGASTRRRRSTCVPGVWSRRRRPPEPSPSSPTPSRAPTCRPIRTVGDCAEGSPTVRPATSRGS